ncbi:small ribosomal subunit Rsm22 family protein [Flexivirga sp. B27]
MERLIERYRRGGAASAPILAGPTDVLAYALYRMPATLAACSAMLAQSAARLPEITSVADLGGGTGAAAWAACEQWPGARIEVRDQVADALRLGRALRADEGDMVKDTVNFVQWQVGSAVQAADLVTVSYVLSELDERAQATLVKSAMDAARRAVAVIEPGTPTGHQRILAARTLLLEAGWQLVAPCPHQADCPVRQPDWCHFSARVERSSIHRQLKGGELGHEDEKFSYVVAVPPGSDVVVGEAEARILRHPVKRKGLVELQLCRPDGTAGRAIVTKRQGPAYKQARGVRWGDIWQSP